MLFVENKISADWNRQIICVPWTSVQEFVFPIGPDLLRNWRAPVAVFPPSLWLPYEYLYLIQKKQFGKFTSLKPVCIFTHKQSDSCEYQLPHKFSLRKHTDLVCPKSAKLRTDLSHTADEPYWKPVSAQLQDPSVNNPSSREPGHNPPWRWPFTKDQPVAHLTVNFQNQILLGIMRVTSRTPYQKHISFFVQENE